jgi:hypothetical protein
VSHAIFFFILVYRVTNYSITVNFQIPQYNTSFNALMSDSNNGFGVSQLAATTAACGTASATFTAAEIVTVQESCNFDMLSIIFPAVPNAKVFDNYALSEAVSAKFAYPCYFDKYILFIVLSNPADMLL